MDAGAITWAAAASLLSLATIVWNLRSIWRDRGASFFHVVCGLFLLTNGTGLYLLSQMEIPEFTGVGAAGIERASKAIVIFIAICFCTAWVRSRIAPAVDAARPTTRMPQGTPVSKVGFLLLLLGVLVILAAGYYFLIYHGALRYLTQAFMGASVEEHYQARAQMDDEFSGAGRGAYLASVMMFNGGPVLLPVLVYAAIKSAQRFTLLLSGVVCVSLLLIALVSAQRAPLLYALLLPLGAWASSKFGGVLPRMRFRKEYIVVALGALAAVTAVGAFVYQLSDGVDFVEGVTRFYTRILLIPAGTGGYYYQSFPDVFAFRGLLGMVYMGTDVAKGSDINFGDVALASTGYRFDANASFLSVGYSGMGFIGVATVSLLLYLLCLFIDSILHRTALEGRLLALLSSIFGIAAVVGTPLVTAVYSFGFGVNAIATVVLFRLCYPRHPSRKSVGRQQGRGRPAQRRTAVSEFVAGRGKLGELRSAAGPRVVVKATGACRSH